MRYINLTSLLIFRSVSTAVCKRFPTIDHVVEAGERTLGTLDTLQPLETLSGGPVEFHWGGLGCGG